MPSPIDNLSDEQLERSVDSVLGQADQVRRDLLLNAIKAGDGIEPGTASRAMEISRENGLPPGVIARALPLYERNRRQRDAQELFHRAPRVMSWALADPVRAAAVRDDLATMSTIERMVTAISSGWNQGVRGNQLGRMGYELMARHGQSDDLRGQIAAIQRELEASPRTSGFASILQASSKIGGQMIEAASGAVEYGLAGAGVGLTAGSAFGGVGAIPGAASGFTAGMTAGITGEMFAISAGHLYLDLDQARGINGEEIPEDVKQGVAIVGGMSEAALEVVGMKMAAAPFKAAGSKLIGEQAKKVLVSPTVRAAAAQFAADYAKAVGGEVGTEVLQEVNSVIAGEVAMMLSTGEFESILSSDKARQDAFLRLFDVGSETLKGMALLGLPGPGVNVASDMVRVRRSRRVQQFFEALGEGAANLKNKGLLNGEMRELVARMTEGGPLEHMYVDTGDWQTYWQSVDEDPREAAREVLGDVDAYDEAVASGGDLVIPTAEYAQKIAPTEHHAALLPSLKFGPNEMTIRESQQFMDQLRSQQEQANTDPQQDPAAVIEQDLIGQLIGTGMDQTTAATNAQLIAAGFRTLAQRAGIDPVQLYQRYGLQIVRHMPEVLQQLATTDTLDVLLDRIRKGDLPRASLLPEGFSRAEVERSLVELAGRHGLPLYASDTITDPELREKAEDGQVFEFSGDMPPELTRHFEENPHLLGVLHSNRPGGTGEDFMAEVGFDKYVELVEQVAAGRAGLVRRAIEFGRQSGDPEAMFLAWLADVTPMAEDRTEKQLINPDRLPVGATFTIEGVPVRVADAIGERMLVADGLEVPAFALDRIPIDEGSLQGQLEPERVRGTPETVLQLDGLLRQLGVDLGSMDNAAVRELLARTAQQVGEDAGAEAVLGQELVIRADGVRSGLSNLPPIQVTSVPGDRFTQGASRDRRKQATNWAVANLVGVYSNQDTGWSIEVGSDGLRHTINHGPMYSTLETLPALPELLKNAVLVESRPDRDGDPNIRAIHRFYAAVEIGGVLNRVKLTVKESKGRKFYNHEAAILGPVGAEKSPGIREESGGPHDLARGTLSIGDLLREVKSDNGTPLLSPADATIPGMTGDEGAGRSAQTPQPQDRPPATDVNGSPIEDLDGNPVPVNADGTLTLYHRTTPEAADRIRSTGRFVSAENTQEVFFSTKLDGLAEGYGDAVVVVKIRPDLVRLDDAFRDGEVHVAVERRRIRDIQPFNQSAPQDGGTFFQSADKSKRGALRIGRGRKRFTIELFAKADLSTVLHETGHLYLEILGDLASDPNSPEQIRQDYQTILDWMGVDGRGKIGVDQHEQFARGFEAYLMEGKAPSADLRGAFARFRAWLLAIYRKIARLNVTLTPEVRGVFDRMLATDEQIALQEQQQQLEPIFADVQEADKAGMTPEQFAEYQAAVELARVEAQERLQVELMNEVRREQQAWWREEREHVRGEVEAEVNGQRVYIAMAMLQQGKLPDGSELPEGVQAIKLSKSDLVDAYGESFLKRLPRPYVYAVEGGVHHDVAADLLGYSSGDELVMELANARDKNALIDSETDARMRDRYGEMLLDGGVADAAAVAVHGDHRAKLLMIEIQQLASRAGGRAAPNDLLRERAQAIIDGKQVRQINAAVYQRAASKAGRAAFTAAADGRYDEALRQKQIQLFNHHLYRLAREAKDEVDHIRQYMAKFGKRTVRANLGKAGEDYLAQVDAILDRYNFERVSQKRAKRQQSLQAWIEQQQAAGYTVDLPEHVLQEAAAESYQNITFAELQGVYDSVRNIEHLASLKNRLLADEKERQYDQVKGNILSSIVAHHQLKDAPVEFAPGLASRWFTKAKEFLAEHAKMEFVFEWLDGNKPQGPVWSHLFKPVADAEAREADMMRDVVANMHRIFGRYTRQERSLWYFRKTFIPEIGVSMNKANMLAVALNMGNQYNRDALMAGYQWNERQVEAILSRLDKRDWDTVQEIWDYINTFWPQIEKQEKELNGLAPEKVEPTQVVTPHGVYRGGYYPIKFDPQLSYRQSQLDEKAAVRDLFGGSWARAATRKGHTKEREGTGGKPLLLNLSVITEHLTNVVHDLAFRKTLIDLNRLTEDEEIRQAIEATAGRELHREIRPWLNSIAADKRQVSSVLESMLSRVRTGTTVAVMGWKLTTALTQLSGYTVSVKELGPKYAAIGLREVYGRGVRQAWGAVTERSAMMRDRMSTFDRDVRSALGKLNVTGADPGIASVVSAWTPELRESFFALIGIMDMGVALPTWMGAYRKALDGQLENIPKGDERAAADYADQVVRQTQGSGSPKDLSRIQRGGKHNTEMLRLATMFYSYFSVLFNQFQKSFRQYKFDRNKGRLIGSMLLLWWLPAVLDDLLVGRGPDDDDEESWLAWLLKKQAQYPAGTIIGVRDIARGMDSYRGYEFSPVVQSLRTIVDTVGVVGDVATGEEVTRADARKAVDAAGVVLALPTRQTWLTLEYLYDWMSGEEEPANPAEAAWRALVTGGEKD